MKTFLNDFAMGTICAQFLYDRENEVETSRFVQEGKLEISS